MNNKTRKVITIESEYRKCCPESRHVPECKSLEAKSRGVLEVPEFGGYEWTAFIAQLMDMPQLA